MCPNCRNSLEESQIFSARLSNLGGAHAQSTDSQGGLREKLADLESQLLMYRERVAYHESVEEELKRNLESQVDVVLKMEEERLKMIKDVKETKDREGRVKEENERMKEKIAVFEKELEDLQVQIKDQMEAAAAALEIKEEEEKENKNTVNRKPVTKMASQVKKPAVKKAVSTLKF